MTVSSGDTGEATASPASLTFTPSNWNTAQTVTVTGVDDPTVDGDQTTTITVAVDDGSSDDAFDPLADQTVSVTTVDDDVAGFTIVESDGATASTSPARPTPSPSCSTPSRAADVVIDVNSADTGEATASPATLTFTPSNWNTAQTVTVTGVDDPSSTATSPTPSILSEPAASDTCPDHTPRPGRCERHHFK